MPFKTAVRVIALSFLAGVAMKLPTWAQQPPGGRPAPVSRPQPTMASEGDEPQATTASFGDWVERCQRLRNGTESLRVCEVAQAIVLQGQNGPVAQLAIGRIKKGDPLRVTLVLPVDVGFPSAPKLAVEGKAAETVELTWRRCVPGGCVADAAISDPILALWRAETVRGRIEGMTGSAQAFQLTFSFNGLGQALASLGKEDQ